LHLETAQILWGGEIGRLAKEAGKPLDGSNIGPLSVSFLSAMSSSMRWRSADVVVLVMGPSFVFLVACLATTTSTRGGTYLSTGDTFDSGKLYLASTARAV
jgi:hypothetical protein